MDTELFLEKLYDRVSNSDVLARVVTGTSINMKCPNCAKEVSVKVLPKFQGTCPQCGFEIQFRFDVQGKTVDWPEDR